MPENRRGIKETKELLQLLITTASVAVDVNKNGVFDRGVIAQLSTYVPKAFKGIKGINQIPAELKDLDQQEIDELSAMVINAFGSHITSQKALKVIETLLELAKSSYQVYLLTQEKP